MTGKKQITSDSQTNGAPKGPSEKTGAAQTALGNSKQKTAKTAGAAASKGSSKTVRPKSSRASASTLKPKSASTAKPAGKQAAKKITKRDRLIGLLSKKGGCALSQLEAELGWQPHTVRAALSGLRKAGYEIEKSKSDRTGPAIYSIIASPEAATGEKSGASS